jgi:hypothetical protein
MRRATSMFLIGLALAAGARAAEKGSVTLFDGKSAAGWVTNTGKPLPEANGQAD